MVKVCGAEVSTPPNAVPPLSIATSVIVAEPLASGAVVKLKSPLDATAGPAENSAALVLLVTTKLTICAASFAGPGEIAVAHPANSCGPASSSTVSFGPFVNDGGSFRSKIVIVTVAVSVPLGLVTVYVNESVGGLMTPAGGVYVKLPSAFSVMVPPSEVGPLLMGVATGAGTPKSFAKTPGAGVTSGVS